MPLLLLPSAGEQAPSSDGVRAYGNISFAATTAGEVGLSLVNPTVESEALTTNAYATEE